LTVPAFNFFWSRDDDCGQKRRYTVKSLKQVVEKENIKQDDTF
jgi:hypothetical protein